MSICPKLTPPPFPSAFPSCVGFPLSSSSVFLACFILLSVSHLNLTSWQHERDSKGTPFFPQLSRGKLAWAAQQSAEGVGLKRVSGSQGWGMGVREQPGEGRGRSCGGSLLPRGAMMCGHRGVNVTMEHLHRVPPVILSTSLLGKPLLSSYFLPNPPSLSIRLDKPHIFLSYTQK